MPWLIILDPEFWWGVLVAFWALYREAIVEFGLLIIFVTVMIWLIYQSIAARREP